MMRILVVDRSRLICDSVRTMLDKEQDMYVVGCATNHDEMNFLLDHANVVLINAALGVDETLSMIEEMHDNQPYTKILVFGVDESPDMILCFIEAGAAGYILQQESIEDLLMKVRAAFHDKALISPGIAAVMMSRLAELSQQQAALGNVVEKIGTFDTLTRREIEVLALISSNYTNQQIAETLFIEYGTVKNHVHNILRKLETPTRNEAAALFKLYEESQHENVC